MNHYNFQEVERLISLKVNVIITLSVTVLLGVALWQIL